MDDRRRGGPLKRKTPDVSGAFHLINFKTNNCQGFKIGVFLNGAMKVSILDEVFSLRWNSASITTHSAGLRASSSSQIIRYMLCVSSPRREKGVEAIGLASPNSSGVFKLLKAFSSASMLRRLRDFKRFMRSVCGR